VYNIARDDMAGGTELIDQTAFSSIQSRTRFQLHTTEAGKKYYEVKQIGDASYPIVKNEQTMIPRAERLLFSQEVLRRPVAAFKQRSRLSYCYGDSFTSKSASDGVVAFLGTPPFEVRVSVKDLAVGETYEEKITVSDTTWAFALPSYTFTSVGPHLVTIESVQDASHCEQAVLDSFRSTMWVDVAETAAIVPYERREHFCVGDASQFQLEGTPPWSIGYVAFSRSADLFDAHSTSRYSVNGKTHTKQSNQSPFTLVQQQSGEFAIHSIAHQQKMCTTTIPDLRWVVHPLPSATVGHGKKIIQDIYEGNCARLQDDSGV
jgi:nucleoporin POM152